MSATGPGGWQEPPWSQPTGYPQQPWPPGGGPAVPQTEQNAVIALVLSIASFAICPFVPAVVALFLARRAEDSIRSSGGYRSGAGMVTAARVIAWANIALSVLVAIGFAVLVGVAVNGSSG